MLTFAISCVIAYTSFVTTHCLVSEQQHAHAASRTAGPMIAFFQFCSPCQAEISTSRHHLRSAPHTPRPMTLAHNALPTPLKEVRCPPLSSWWTIHMHASERGSAEVFV